MGAKHTLGPWAIRKENESFISISAENHYSLIDTWAIDEGISKEQMQANARLIAAAPELLEALRDMVSDRKCLSEATVNFARAAIAKATGDQ